MLNNFTREIKFQLLGLLRFLLHHTKSEDAKESTCQEMDAEKKQFLESALNCMTTDVMKEFQNAILILDDHTSEDTDKINALTTIRESIDDMDFANSFVKAGGSVYLIKCLTNTDYKIKGLSAYIIAEMSQNNEFCQKHFVDSKTIPILIKFLNGPAEIANSGSHAISSLIQNFEPGLTEFLNLDGINTLLSCLDKNDSKLFLKVCSLIGKLGEHEDLRDELVEKQAIMKLVQCLPMRFVKYDTNLETAFYALSELSKSSKWIVDKVQAEKLENLASGIVKNNTIEPEYEEIYGYACLILQRLETGLVTQK
ncbi:uncharacterized protein LOC128862921 isoform X1 [Anastrepha ludens]|uniref:uncharacterized protein LOC128862921 isoform X1 n=1 Tax=Anastrepha ludens TaxID=28586 RepID=UPI0023B0B3E4|nr:uncharacterized protein LOC128862921 isoform X1 [Anastrepha ludens]